MSDSHLKTKLTRLSPTALPMRFKSFSPPLTPPNSMPPSLKLSPQNPHSTSNAMCYRKNSKVCWTNLVGCWTARMIRKQSRRLSRRKWRSWSVRSSLSRVSTVRACRGNLCRFHHTSLSRATSLLGNSFISHSFSPFIVPLFPLYSLTL